MHTLKKYWHAFTHASTVVEIWHALQFVAGPVVAFMTFMAAVGQDIPLAYVIAATIVAFGGAVWTINQLGILFGKPLIARSVEDYSYGLAYNGVSIGFDPENEEATLQVRVHLANACRQPLRYKVERFDVIVGNRAITDRKYLNDGGYMPLIATRQYNHAPFKKEIIKDLIGKRTDGTIEIHIIYGHPEREFVRRMKMKLDISLRLDDKFSVSDIIREESDEPIF